MLKYIYSKVFKDAKGFFDWDFSMFFLFTILTALFILLLIVVDAAVEPVTLKVQPLNHNYSKYSLVSIGEYYVGREIVDGEAKYIFEIDVNGKHKVISTSVDKVEIVKDDKAFVLVDISKVKKLQRSRITGTTRWQNDVEIMYTIHVPDPNKIKDYGVRQTKDNGDSIIIPWFIYYPPKY